MKVAGNMVELQQQSRIRQALLQEVGPFVLGQMDAETLTDAWPETIRMRPIRRRARQALVLARRR